MLCLKSMKKVDRHRKLKGIQSECWVCIEKSVLTVTLANETFLYRQPSLYRHSIQRQKLSEAILTNIQNICSMWKYEQNKTFLTYQSAHYLKYSVQQQIHFNGNVFAAIVTRVQLSCQVTTYNVYLYGKIRK